MNGVDIEEDSSLPLADRVRKEWGLSNNIYPEYLLDNYSIREIICWALAGDQIANYYLDARGASEEKSQACAAAGVDKGCRERALVVRVDEDAGSATQALYVFKGGVPSLHNFVGNSLLFGQQRNIERARYHLCMAWLQGNQDAAIFRQEGGISFACDAERKLLGRS
ncbi:MAG: hypothetical protein QM698_11370 [Micropepsaceae bacterium]